MRNLLMVLVVVALVAAPAMANVNLKLVPADLELNPGESTTVSVQAMCSTRAIGQVAGSIAGTTTGGGLTASGWAWIAQMMPGTQVNGTAAVNGGMTGFGAGQKAPLVTTLGNGALVPLLTYAEVASYTVTAPAVVAAEYDITLVFTPGVNGGYGFKSTLISPPANYDSTVGTLTSGLIHVTPEPITMALLAMGGLFIARRRSH